MCLCVICPRWGAQAFQPHLQAGAPREPAAGAAWLAEPMSVVLKETPGKEMEVEPVSALGSPRGCGRRPTHGACPGL